MVNTDVQRWAARSRAWIGLLVMAPFACLALLSTPIVSEGTWGDFDFDVAAWILFLMGGGMRAWATLYIGAHKNRSLVTDGPYSICRNPLYLGTFLLGLAVAVYLKSLTFAVGLLVATVIYLGTTLPVEEKRLRKKFGDEFDRYCARVPRLIPRLDLYHTSPTIQLSVGGLTAEVYRAARWVWLPVLCELFAHLRAESWWPRILHFP